MCFAGLFSHFVSMTVYTQSVGMLPPSVEGKSLGTVRRGAEGWHLLLIFKSFVEKLTADKVKEMSNNEKNLPDEFAVDNIDSLREVLCTL